MLLLCLMVAWQGSDLHDVLTQIKERPDQIQAFINEQGGLPIISGNDVLFLALSPQSVPRLIADHNFGPGRYDPKVSGEAMKPIADSHWYYAMARLADGARIEYRFLINGERVTDPHNPKQAKAWSGMVSELRLNDYLAYPELTEPPAAKGKVRKQSFYSKIMNNTRDVHIYTPPGYDNTTQRYPTVYLNDGTLYVNKVQVPRILDYLIGKGQMEKVIAVFVDPVNRREEYRMNPQFRGMFIDELLPMIDQNYRTQPTRNGRLIVGGSRGGLCATDLVSHHGDVFAMAAPIAPALKPTDLLAQLAEDQTHPVSFFVIGCLYDERFYPDAVALNKHLQQKGWPVTYIEIPEGHNATAWSRRIDEILRHFFGN